MAVNKAGHHKLASQIDKLGFRAGKLWDKLIIARRQNIALAQCYGAAHLVIGICRVNDAVVIDNIGDSRLLSHSRLSKIPFFLDVAAVFRCLPQRQ
ncbi:hypothetical protein DJ62_3730 [Yersinia enterocolitica]|nr:hypothetical protein DJ62_3730 [Yersinia enterocolitica]